MSSKWRGRNSWLSAVVASAALASGCGEDTMIATSDGPVPEADVVTAYEEAFRENNPYDEVAVERNGLQISTRRFASLGPASGAPIVLLHGYPDSQHLYDRVIPFLRQNREVWSFDFIGWGGSAKPAADGHDFDAGGLLLDLEAVLSHIDAETLVLVVHDAGAWPGIDWSLAHPERIGGLVVLNSVYHPTPAAAMPPEGLVQYSEDNAQAIAERTLADFDAWIHGDEGVVGYRWQIGVFMANAEARAELLPILEAQSADMRPAFIELAGLLFETVADRVPAIAELQAFEPPVRVVFGTLDPYLNLDVAADFDRLFPNSTRVDIEGAHHYVQVDRPQEVADQILLMGGQ